MPKKSKSNRVRKSKTVVNSYKTMEAESTFHLAIIRRDLQRVLDIIAEAGLSTVEVYSSHRGGRHIIAKGNESKIKKVVSALQKKNFWN